jgi:hypothetical protein
MTNPETDPLHEVETYLVAGEGLWSMVVPSLRESILNNETGDEGWSKEIREAVQITRQHDYENVIRKLAKQCAAFRR